MNCGVVMVEEDQEEDQEERAERGGMKTTIKMHKTFYAVEMSRDVK